MAPYSNPSPFGGDAISTGAIIGIAVGSAALLLAVAAIFFYLRRLNRRQHRAAIGPKKDSEMEEGLRSYSLGNDPTLSFVSSYLATCPPTTTLSQPTKLAPPGSGTVELNSNARMWEVPWSELSIMRRIGQGSFGTVYLGEWNQTQVAVKLLVGKGEQCFKTGILVSPDQQYSFVLSGLTILPWLMCRQHRARGGGVAR